MDLEQYLKDKISEDKAYLSEAYNTGDSYVRGSVAALDWILQLMDDYKNLE